MLEPLDARLGLVTGKGGVGKTCVVAALGLAAADAGRRPIVVELGHRASLEALFGQPIGFSPVSIAPGLVACNLEIDATLRDYVERYVRFRRLADAILDNRALARFFRAAPAVTEVAALARIAALLDEGYDPVLVDLDATGHALMMLELPGVFADLGVGGPVRRLLARAEALFADEETRVHVVTLPGALPVQESIELCEALAARARLGALIVNRVPPDPWPHDDEALTRIEARAAALGERALIDDCALVRRAVARHRALRDSLAGLDAIAAPRLVLTERELTGPDDLRALLATAEVRS